jgi:hypothetical protein
MLICDDFQLVNQFSERNDNSHKEIITFEIHEVVAQRFALLALGRAWILFWSRENSKPVSRQARQPENA